MAYGEEVAYGHLAMLAARKEYLALHAGTILAEFERRLPLAGFGRGFLVVFAVSKERLKGSAQTHHRLRLAARELVGLVLTPIPLALF